MCNSEKCNHDPSTEVEILHDVKRRMPHFIHFIANEKYRFLQLVSQGEVEGRCRRRKQSDISDLKKPKGLVLG